MIRTSTVLIVVLSMVLTGCGLPLGGSLTMEQAIVEALSRDPSEQMLTDPEIRATRQLPQGTVVLITYEAERDGEHVMGLQTMMLERRVGGWSPGSSGGTAYPIDDPLPPVSFSAGSTTSGFSAFAEASGLVSDPAVRAVAVKFSDGSQEVSPVENGAYLVVKTGRHTVTHIEALDEQGNVVYQDDFTAR